MIKTILHWGQGFFILTGLYLAGELLSTWLGLLLPGSLVGMLLLVFLLFGGILKLEQIERAADDLLQHLILLFVPASVGIMVYAKSFSGNAFEIILNILLSTVLVLAVTGKTVDKVIDW
ncbi:MAG TPA: CidA/LrgA family protein, partial [Negativicutes bacterium]